MSAQLDLDDVAAQSPLAQQELAELRKLLAEAKRDSEPERKRLDAAIDLLGRCEALTYDYDEGIYHIDWGYVDGVFGPEGYGKTPREAIDAAIKAKEAQ